MNQWPNFSGRYRDIDEFDGVFGPQSQIRSTVGYGDHGWVIVVVCVCRTFFRPEVKVVGCTENQSVVFTCIGVVDVKVAFDRHVLGRTNDVNPTITFGELVRYVDFSCIEDNVGSAAEGHIGSVNRENTIHASVGGPVRPDCTSAKMYQELLIVTSVRLDCACEASRRVETVVTTAKNSRSQRGSVGPQGTVFCKDAY